MKRLTIFLLLSVITLHGVNFNSVYAEPLGSLTSYSPQTGSNDRRDIVEGADGNLWILQDNPKSIAVVSKSGAHLNTFALPASLQRQTNRLTLIGDKIWFTLTSNGTQPIGFGSIDMQGNISTYNMDIDRRGELSNIVRGSDGYLYIASYFGGDQNGKIQKYTVNGQFVRSYDLGRVISPRELAADQVNGVVWYGGGPVNAEVGYINATGTITKFNIPTYLDSMRSLVVGPDSKIWFSGSNNKLQAVDINGNFTPVYTSTSPSFLTSGLDGYLWLNSGNNRSYERFNVSTGNFNYYGMPGNWGTPNRFAMGSDLNMWSIDNELKKVHKIGTGITSNSNDSDQDGLNVVQEFKQGTNDNLKDTDGDGLSDYIESIQNPNRLVTFCGTYCAYPDPLVKDLYVEIDWMQTGNFSTKPTASELSYVKNVYLSKNIRAHFDTGQYGGGNQVDYVNTLKAESTSGTRDLFDYKRSGDGLTQQFDVSNRYQVWRYMISADHISADDVTDGSLLGAGIPGDDDSLLAYGTINANQPTSADRELHVKKTILHELGHNLCLSGNLAYQNQSSLCIYQHIDSFNAPFTYDSAMNYNIVQANYSDGLMIPNDHNDWKAISTGMKDFTLSQRGDEDVVNNSMRMKNKGIEQKKSPFLSTKTR